MFSSPVGYHDAMTSELMKEVAITHYKRNAVAVINDDSTEVGLVHFGVVHNMHAPDETVAGRRSGILAPEFISTSEVLKDLSGYESWSRFCLEHLAALLSKAALQGVTA